MSRRAVPSVRRTRQRNASAPRSTEIAGFQELVAQQTVPGIMGQITAARKARIGVLVANWEWNSLDYWMTALRRWRRVARTITCSGQRAESSRGVLDGQFLTQPFTRAAVPRTAVAA